MASADAWREIKDCSSGREHHGRAQTWESRGARVDEAHRIRYRREASYTQREHSEPARSP